VAELTGTAGIKSEFLPIAITRSEMICTLFLVAFFNANIRISAADCPASALMEQLEGFA
jgi:hypothetical protein